MAGVAERHLVIVLDPVSQPGMGISLELSDVHEEGTAANMIPSLVPPAPLTHLWPHGGGRRGRPVSILGWPASRFPGGIRMSGIVQVSALMYCTTMTTGPSGLSVTVYQMVRPSEGRCRR